MRKIKRAFFLLLELIKYESAWLAGHIMMCFDKEYRRVWIFAERGREAKDNAFHLFSYVRANHPEINAWYVADPSLPDFERVKKRGKTVPYRSWKHYMLCAAARVKISTHISGYTPDIDKYYMLDKLNVVRGCKIFLQHGIILDDMEWYHYPNVKTDLFVCSLEKEFQFVQKTFGYPEGVVKRLGLCRFDALLEKHETKKQLLIMPTWRNYAVEGKSREEFCQTEYFRKWQELLGGAQLQELLEKYDYRAVFYPHFEIQRFLEAFQVGGDRIRLGVLGQEDVQRLLMESAILLTDFSSVQYDFAYMKKQEIYYQFDEQEFWQKHHNKGEFDYREDGFGEVVTDYRELLSEIERVLAMGGNPEEKYRKRIEGFFDRIDRENCRRNFQAILELEGRNRKWKREKM